MKRVFPQRVPSRFLVAIAAVYSSVLPITVFAGPEGGEVVGGRGSITQSGNTTTIDQATDRMAIDWQSFDVAVDERVNFIQPDSSSISLNRILSNSGSQIHGRIDANGHVFLVNPNGVFFGKDSVINAGGILASGLSLDPDDFMNGDFAFSALEGTDGMVINAGLIHAATGGSVSLLGQQVQNDGMISAQLGAVNLAAGKEAIVTFDGDGLLGVQVTQSILQDEIGVDAAVINNGEITAEDGQILLSASASQNIFSQAVNAGEVRQATSVVMDEDGGFTLSAGANVVNTGALSVSGDTGGALVVLGENVTSSGHMHADAASGERAGVVEVHSVDTTLLTENAEVTATAVQGVGGSVAILGDKVGVLDASRIDASGAAGGGYVYVGGDYRGENLGLRNASRTYLSAGSDIFADALYEGNGGRVIVWANETTVFYGDISVTGGALYGDGGFVEVSGKENLGFYGLVDRTAVNGEVGALLLDPLDIGIWTRTDDDSEVSDREVLFGESSTSTFWISAGSIETALESGNVSLEARRDIVVFTSITAESDSTSSLSFYAGDDVIIDDSVQIDLGDGNILMVAGATGCVPSCGTSGNGFDEVYIDAGASLTTTGSIDLYAGQDIRFGDDDDLETDITGGTLTFRAGDEIFVDDDVDIVAGSGGVSFSTYDTDLQTESLTVAPVGTPTGNLSIEGDVQSTGGGGVTGDVTNFDLVDISGAQLDSNGGDINFAVSGTIDVRRSIISDGGDITFASDSNRAADFDSDRSNALINSSDTNGGGDISVYTSGTIDIGTIQAHDANADDAGSVTLTFDSSGGNVTLAQDFNYEYDNIAYITNLQLTAGADILINGRTIDNDDGSNLLNMSLTAGNDIVVDGGTEIWLTGGTFTADATNNFSYGSAANSRSHLDSEGGNVTIDAGGSVQIFSNDGIETAGGNFTVGGSRIPTSFSYDDANAATGDIDTETNAADSESGNVSITSSGAVTLGGITTSNGDSCGGGSDPCGDLSITAGGNITQNSGSALVINGTTTFDADGFNVQLEETSNDFAIVTVTTAADVILDEANDIEFSNVTVTGDDSEARFTIDAAGAITQTAATEIASNAGGDIELTAATTLTIVDINTSTTADNISAGAVTLSGADIDIAAIDTSAAGAAADGGDITVDITSSFDLTGAVDASSDQSTGGSFTVTGDDTDNTFTIDTGATWTSDQTFLVSGEDGADTFYLNSPLDISVFGHAESGSAGVPDGDNIFYINAAISGLVEGEMGADTFHINADGDATIRGRQGDDIFNIASSYSGTIEGNWDSDTFNILTGGIDVTIDGSTGGTEVDILMGVPGDPNSNAASQTINYWSITDSTLDNEATDTGNVVAFSNIEVLQGGDEVEEIATGDDVGGVDIFNIQTDFDGTINGGSAVDTFNVTTATADISGALNGDAGADVFNIDFAVTTGTINGGDDGDTFTLAADVVTVNGDSGNDTFTVTADLTGTLNGGVGDDTFDLSNDVPNVNGDTGNDSFNLLANNITAVIAGGESDPDNETDTITGFSDTTNENDWTITDGEEGQVVNGETVTFTQMEAILGSTVDDAGGDSDIFTLNADFDGSIDAQGGNDSLFVVAEDDYTVSFTSAVGGITGVESIANNTGSAANFGLILAESGNSGTATYNTWTITASSTTANSGTIEEYDTDDALLNTITFTNFDSFTGNALPDTFDVTDSGVGGPYSIDALAGGDGADTFNIGIEVVSSITGGLGDDTFDFSTGGSSSGTLTGGDADTRDVIIGQNVDSDYVLSDATAFAGSIAVDGGADYVADFQGVEELQGGSGTADEIIGRNQGNFWDIEASGNTVGDNDVAGSATDLITFSNMELLTGNADADYFRIDTAFADDINAAGGDDTFDFSGGGSSTGTINAGAEDVRDVLIGQNIDSDYVLSDATANAGSVAADGGANYVDDFQGVEELQGGSGTADELFGRDQNNFWDIEVAGNTVGDNATASSATDLITFTGMEELTGESNDDYFTISTAFSGDIDAAAGDDTFDFSGGGSSTGTIDGGDETTRDVLIGQNNDSDFVLSDGTANAGSVAADGGANYVDDFQGVEELQGGSGTADELFGRDQNNFWDIEVAGNTVGNNATAGSATDLITFTGMEELTGEGNDDYFTISTAFSGDIDAAAGDDTFDFSGGGSATGTLDAGDETTRDVLIGQNIDSDYVLDDATAFAGSVAADGGADYVADFQGVEELQGGSGTADELFGRAQDNYWDIAVAGNTVGDDPTAGSATDLITFSNIEALTGESSADYFDVDTTFSGGMSGAGGVDTFDFATSGGTATGTVDGGAGNDDFLVANSIAGQLNGGDGDDELFVQAGDITLDFNGQGDTDTVYAFDDNTNTSTWTISTGTLVNAGAVTETVGFSNVEVLSGSTGADIFAVDALFDGTITGDTGADTLTVTVDTNTWTITDALDGEIDTSDGGTAANITFTDIQTINGNSSDTLVGRSGQTNTWEINSTSGGTVNSSTSGDTMTFTGMSTLTGGDGIDNFNVDNGSSFAGTLNGEGNNDVFTLENDVTVAANGGDGEDQFNVSTSITGTLAGDDDNDQLTVLANDIAIASFNGGNQTDTVVGVDDLANANTWAVSAGTLTNAASANVINYSNVETLTGGTGVDNFTVASAFTGTLNGMGNADTFALTASVTTVNGGDGDDSFTVTDGITTLINGDGDDDTLTGDNTTNAWLLATANAGSLNTTISFTTMEELIGNAGTDTLTGINQNNDWQITGGNSGTVSLQGNTADLVTFSEMENVTGGTGNDIFTFGLSGDLTNVNGGASGTDRIVARNVANTWRLGASSGSLEVTSPADVYITSFSNIDELYGSASFADEFLFSAAVTYTIDAGASAGDEANYSGVSDNIAVTVGAGAINGLVGIEQVVGNNDGVLNVTYESNLTLDSSLDANWEISDVSGGDGVNDGRITFGPNTVDFINFSGLTGGSGNDTFDLDAGSASGVSDYIYGGDNNAAGDNIVARNTNTTWNVYEDDTLGVGNEFAFGDFTYDNGLPGTTTTEFRGVEILNGSESNDGFSVGTFNESGAFAITLNAGGGAGTDTITLPDQNLAITLGVAVGGLGLTGIETITADEDRTNSFTVTSLSSQTVTWDITSANSGTVTTPDGTTTFNNFQTLTGGTGNDSFSINTNGEVDTLIDGAGGTNTLTGKNVANRWNIDGSSTGSIDDMTGAADRYVGGFQNIDTLTGSGISNDFVFDAAGSFDGTLIGGAGTDTVQVAAMTDHDTLWLIDPTGAIDNQMQRADSSDNSVVDSTVTLQNIENLTGGAATDKFIFSQNGTYTGTLDAAGGTDDVVDLSGISGTVSATLGAAQIAGVDNAERVIGNGANSTLNGLSSGTNAWVIYEFDAADPDVRLDGADDGTLANGSTSIEFVDFHYLQGSDTATDEFTLSTNGSVTGRMTGGGGVFVDQVTGANVSNDWYLTTALAGTVNGSAFSEIDAIVGGTDTDNLYGRVQENNWQINGDDAGYVQGMDASDRMVFSSEIENVFGRSDNDHFVFTTSGTLSGILNASDSADGAGDTLTMQSGTSDTVTWTINGLSSGLVATRLAGGFSNIDSVIGDAGLDNVTVNSTFSGTITTNAGVDTINLLADVTGDISTGAGNDVININNSAVDANVIAGGDSDTFALGHTDGSTWTIDGLDSGDVAATGTVTFSGVETVQGNSAQDRVSVTNDFNGIIQTLGGNDLVTLNNDVALGVETGSGDDVISIAATGLTTDIDAGASDTDRVRVTHTSASLWTINGSNSVDGVTFSEVEEIEGNDAVDTVNVTTAIDTILTNGNADVITLGAGVTTVEAGDGNDDIRISVDGITIADLDGGIGTDTLSMTHLGASTWIFNTVETVDNVTFNDIEIAQGNSATDTFNVLTSFNQLNGGAGNDQFNVSANVTDLNAEDGADVIDILVDDITVDVDGGNDANTDVLMISHAGESNWTINGSNTVDNVAFAEIETVQGNDNVDTVNVTVDFGTIETFGGADVVTVGANVTSVQLGNDDDTVTVSATGITTNISGGGGTDTLISPARASGETNTWNITSSDDTLNATVTFSTIENYHGNDANDHFILEDGVTVSEIRGLSPLIASDSGSDTLEVSSAYNTNETWNIDGDGQGGVTGRVTDFYDIENLTGGEGVDTFTFNSTSSAIAGLIDGGERAGAVYDADTNPSPTSDGMIDVLNLTVLTTGVVVELGPVATVSSNPQPSVSDNVHAHNIERIIAYDDSVRGDENQLEDNNWLVVTHGNDYQWDVTAFNQGLTRELLLGTSMEMPNTVVNFHNFGSMQGGNGSEISNISENNNITGTYVLGDGRRNLIFDNIDPADLVVVDLDENLISVTGNGNTILRVAASETDLNANNIWEINAENAGTFTVNDGSMDPFTLDFVDVNQLVGGTGADSFSFVGDGNLVDGSIDGNGGVNTITATTANLDLVFGINEMATGLPVTGSYPDNMTTVDAIATRVGIIDLLDISNLTGNPAATVTLYSGSAGDYTWNISSGGNSLSNATQLLSFSDVDNVIGGDGNDTFNISQLGVVTDDYDGGSGTDIVNITTLTSAAQISLDPLVTTDTDIQLSNVETLNASSVDHTLVGGSAQNDWSITDSDDGSVDYNNGAGAATLTFTNLSNLVGGAGIDTFEVTGDGAVSGLITGGGNNDVLNISTLADGVIVSLDTTISADFNVTGIEDIDANPANDNSFIAESLSNAWTMSGTNGGTVANGSYSVIFSGFANIMGGGIDDTFYFDREGSNDDQLTGILHGGNGTDIVNIDSLQDLDSVGLGSANVADLRLVAIEEVNATEPNSYQLRADNVTNVWEITGTDAGTVGATTFTGFGYLVGGTGNDVFILDRDGGASVDDRITTMIDGGAEPGTGTATDTLDLSGLVDAVIVSLDTTYTADLYVQNFEVIGASDGPSNTLVGEITDNTWDIDAQNGGELNNVEFTNFENLVGRNGIDTFSFAATGSVDGFVDGGDQPTGTRDVVDLSEIANATVIIGDTTNGFDNIEEYRGGGATSLLRAADLENTWTVDALNSGNIVDENGATIAFSDFGILEGGSDEDHFTLDGGAVSGEIRAGAGNDDLTVMVDGVTNGQVTFVGGDDTDDITVQGGVSGMTASYVADVDDNASLTYDVQGASTLVSYSVNYSEVESVDDEVVASSLTVNDILGQMDTVALVNDSFQVNALARVDFTNKESLIVSAEQGDETVIQGTVQLNNMFEVLNAGVSVFDENAQVQALNVSFNGNDYVGASTAPVRVSTDNLSLQNVQGVVYLEEANDVNIETLSNMAGLVDIEADGNIQDTGALSSTQALYLESVTGAITLDNTNNLTGEVHLSAAGNATLTNNASTTLGDVTVQSFDLSAAGNVSDNGVINVTGVTTISNASSITLDNPNNDFGGLVINNASSVDVVDVDDINFEGDAVNAMTVTAAGGIATTGSVAAGDVSLNSSGAAVTVNNNITADNSIVLNGESVVVNGGLSVTANLRDDAVSINGGSGNVDIMGPIDTVSSGSSGDVVVVGQQISQTLGAAIAATDVRYTAALGIDQASAIDASGDVVMSAAGGNIVMSDNAAISAFGVQLDASGDVSMLAIDADNMVVSGTNVTNNADVDLVSGTSINAAGNYLLSGGNTLTVTNGNFLIDAGVLDIDGTIVLANGDLTLASGTDTTLTGSLAATNVALTSGDTLGMAGSSGIQGSESVSLTAQNDITLSTLTSEEGIVTVNSTAGRVDDNNGESVNIVAAEFFMDTAQGVGSLSNQLDTDVNEITALNTDGGLYVSNDRPVTVNALISEGDVYIENDGTITLGLSEVPFDRSAATSRAMGGVVTSSYDTGTVTIVVNSGNLLASGAADADSPDVTGDIVDVTVGGSFGGGGRPLVIYARTEMILSAFGGIFPIWGFGDRPDNGLTTTADLLDSTALGSVTDLLIDVESIEQIDPAVFSEVRNYSYDNISIRMPRDQLYEDQLEDEEEDEEDVDIIL